MARRWYTRAVIQGAAKNGPWRQVGRPPFNGGTVHGNMLVQNARFSPHQMEGRTWHLTPWGQRLEKQALVFRVSGVVTRA